MRQRLTETQYRRVALLWGFHGPPLTVRQVAQQEKVYPNAIQQSHAAAMAKLSNDARLLLLWLTIWI